MAKNLTDLLTASYSLEDMFGPILGYNAMRHPKIDSEALEREWGPYSDSMRNQMVLDDIIKYAPAPAGLPIPYSGKDYYLSYNGAEPEADLASGAASWRGDASVQRYLPDPYNPDEMLPIGESINLPEGKSVVFREGDDGAYVIGHELLHLEDMIKDLNSDQHHNIIDSLYEALHNTVTM